MGPTGWAWFSFALCGAVLAVAGARLSRYGDVISDKTGISGNWIGLVLLSSVTSLPELATGLSAVTVAQAPNIAVGNVLGSCIFNLLTLVVVDSLHRGESVYRRVGQGHILSAGFGVILIGFVGMNVLLAGRTQALSLGHVGAYSPLIVFVYLLAVRSSFEYESERSTDEAAGGASRYPGVTLREAITRFSLAAVAVLAAGIWLPFAALRLAEAMGWHSTFVGTLFVAAATVMPEMVVTVSAMRIGAVDMAISNLLGSNLFNMAILAVADLAFTRGPLLSHVSPMHAVSAASAVVMYGIVIVAIVYRPRARLFQAVGWVSLALVTVYLLNAYFLFLHGE